MMNTLITEAPTQRLRSMIADSEAGLVPANELLNELSNLEVLLGLPLTEPEEP